MPEISILADGIEIFHVDTHPLPPPEPSLTRACLLYMHLHYPTYIPSQQAIKCAEKLKAVLLQPLPTDAASKNRILGVIASCQRNLLGADTVEAVAYAVGGPVAIVALEVVAPGHRAELLKTLRELDSTESKGLFQALAEVQPDNTFTAYINKEITEAAVNKTKVPPNGTTFSTITLSTQFRKRKRGEVRVPRVTRGSVPLDTSLYDGYMKVRKAITTNPGVVILPDSYRAMGTRSKVFGALIRPHIPVVETETHLPLRMQVVEGIYPDQRDQYIRIVLYVYGREQSIHDLVSRPYEQAPLWIFDDAQISSEAIRMEAAKFLEGQDEIYKITVYTQRNLGIFEKIFHDNTLIS
ncbi:hypothetical protein B0T24DRAFT_310544 [Lasiosphaeria ovina]|uniref:Uncharacterized protein n=1 Tax=Lasiosphaeria ovina TaxID=92902 RepID=A0AAE0N5T5_9PEZI|nr:hypothetical protein B0T24DRAFT_310544 [Lasiosphaeria ovina]